jgi:hypothetical protein
MRQNPITQAEGWKMWHEAISNLEHTEENKRHYDGIMAQGQIKESYLVNRSLDPRMVDYSYQESHFYMLNRDKILFKEGMKSDIKEDSKNPGLSKVSQPNSILEMVTYK